MLPFDADTLLTGAVLVLLTGLAACFLFAYPRSVRERRRQMEGQVAAPPLIVPREDGVELELPAPPAAEAAPAEAVAPEPVAPPVPTPPRRREADFGAGLRSSRAGLFGRLDKLLRGRTELDAATLGEVEEILFGADLGVRTADELLQSVRDVAPDQVNATLESRALEILRALPATDAEPTQTPHVILVVGVNGSGKTTSIGKLAQRYMDEGKRVLVAAGDTYRAAAIEQLGIWAERSGADIVRGQPGGDPASVAFDAVKAAGSRDIDVLLIDTAGRLQTDQGLMDELAKIQRVMKKEIPSAPHEVILVLDGNTGQNAIRQAQEFSRAVDVTHILLTKLDGTAKGGVVLGIAQELGLPVRYVGMGEGIEDLYDFDAEAFVRALFTPDAGDQAASA